MTNNDLKCPVPYTCKNLYKICHPKVRNKIYEMAQIIYIYFPPKIYNCFNNIGLFGIAQG